MLRLYALRPLRSLRPISNPIRADTQVRPYLAILVPFVVISCPFFLLVLSDHVSQSMLFGVRDRQRPAADAQLLGKLGGLVM